MPAAGFGPSEVDHPPAAVELDRAARHQDLLEAAPPALHPRLHPRHGEPELGRRLRLRQPGQVDQRQRLAGVVAQLLCKRIPKGRCAVHEILLTHEALPNTIRTGQIANIKSIIESGSGDGMITMDNSLMARVKDGTIDILALALEVSNTIGPLAARHRLAGKHDLVANERKKTRRLRHRDART